MVSRTAAPLLTTKRLNEPLLPTLSRLPICQRAVGLSNRTSLDLAVVLRPMVPLTELLRKALSESTSSVKGPLVQTVTSPAKVLVMLSKVLVAPSLTTWAKAVGSGGLMVERRRARRRRFGASRRAHRGQGRAARPDGSGTRPAWST